MAFNTNAEKIKVVYCGRDSRFSVIEDKKRIQSIRKKYGLPEKGRCILYVGRHELSKNLVGLITAFSVVCGKLDDVCLVIAGEKDSRYPAPYKLVDKLGVGDKVLFTGFVPESDLPLLYNSCDLFVLPSFYEGFGIPVLEAMACGIPVIASNNSSFPEVVGDAGVLVDPYNTDDMAVQMERVLSDETLREDMVKKGVLQIQGFSWKTAAMRTIEVYHDVLGKNI